MSQSFTILPFINPPAGAYDSINAVSSLNNNFTVSQSFNGIVNSGPESCASLTVSGPSTFTGVCNFNSIPKFNAGVEIAISEVNTGTLIVAGQSTLNGGLVVAGIVELPAGTINQSEVQNGYVDLSSAQTVAGIKTFSSPIVSSGASLSAGSIPALSIVNKSLSDAQIALSGVGQTSVSSGYVDLVNAQTVAGAKTFSSAVVASAGLSVSGGAGTFSGGLSTTTLSTSLGATIGLALTANGISSSSSLSSTGNLTVGGSGAFTFNVTAPSFTGALVGNATTATTASAVSVISDNTSGVYSIPFIKSNVASDALYVDDITTPTLTYNPSTGALGTGALTVSTGITTLSGGIVLPVSQITLALTAGVININLNNLSFNEFILPASALTANITGIAVANAIVNSEFNIYIQGGAANRNISKNLSSGTVLQVNTLAGNTQIAAGSVWRCTGKILTPTLMSLEFRNFT